jgi:hypothetical protein
LKQTGRKRRVSPGACELEHYRASARFVGMWATLNDLQNRILSKPGLVGGG